MDNSQDLSDGIKNFYPFGDLIGMLVASDLAYAGVINKPTVEEMSKLIAKVSKGAIVSLIYLQLLSAQHKSYVYPKYQTVNAFTEIYNYLKEELSDIE